MSNEFSFLETSSLGWCFYWKKQKKTLTTAKPSKKSQLTSCWGIQSRCLGQLQVGSGWEPRQELWPARTLHDTRHGELSHSRVRDTRARTGAEQGHPRLQRFRLKGIKPQQFLFWGPSSGASAWAVCCYSSVIPLFKRPRGLRLCMGNLGLSWWGKLFWLWVGVWSPGDLLGHWSHPVKGPRCQQWQSGVVGVADRGSWMSRQKVIAWAWVLMIEVVLRKVSCFIT